MSLGYLLIYSLFLIIAIEVIWVAIVRGSLSDDEKEACDNARSIYTLVAGVILVLLLVFRKELEWKMFLAFSILGFSTLEVFMNISKLKLAPINESAKKKLIMAEPLSIVFSVLLATAILLDDSTSF